MHEENFNLSKNYIVLNDEKKLEDLILKGFDIDKNSENEHYSLVDYFLMFSQNFERSKIASLLYSYSRKALSPKEILFFGIIQNNPDILFKINNTYEKNDKTNFLNKSLNNLWDDKTPIEMRKFWTKSLNTTFLSIVTGLELLELATRVGNLSLVNACIDHFSSTFDINDFINVRNDAVIHIASGLGYSDTIKLLIDRGSNINISNKFLWTPIHFATRYGHLEAVKLLKDNGADLTLKTLDNQTAIDLAYKSSEDKIIAALTS